VRLRDHERMNTQTESSHAPLLVSKKQAASILGLSVRTVENYINSKALTARKAGRRTLITFASLQAFSRRDHASPTPNMQSGA
jgi:excisionase family DNA binding protein